MLLVAWVRPWPWRRAIYRRQRAAGRQPRLLRQRGAIDQRPERIQRLRVLLQQLSARIEECELQEALGAIALDTRSELLVHVLARMLWVEEQRVEECGDESFASDEQGLVRICNANMLSTPGCFVSGKRRQVA